MTSSCSGNLRIIKLLIPPTSFSMTNVEQHFCFVASNLESCVGVTVTSNIQSNYSVMQCLVVKIVFESHA